MMLNRRDAVRALGVFAGSTLLADEAGAIILAPFACCGTWDAIQSCFGADIAILDAALKWTFDRCTIAPSGVTISGFSDGGTYSLAVGRANGDFFSRVVAYSPGFLIPIEPRGKPPILSRTAHRTPSCRSIRPAPPSCPCCATMATRWTTASSPADMRCCSPSWSRS